jgi:hypothetical protein
MESLGTVFNDGDPAEEVETPIAEETPEVETSEAETPETVEPEEAPTAPETEPEQTMVPIAGLKAERVKRQALEKQVKEFEASKTATPAPDIFENQEGYTRHITAQMNSAMFNERANMSEFYARREHADLDSKVEQYQALLAENPNIQGQVQNAVSPYHEIVDIVDKHAKLAKMENVDQWEADKTAELEAKIRAEMEAKYKGESEANQAKRDAIPTSLVGESSLGGMSKSAPVGQASLSNIFND